MCAYNVCVNKTSALNYMEVSMRTLDQIREALSDRKTEIVAEACGAHYNTIREIQRNPKANPTWRVIQALNSYLDEREGAK